MSDRTPHEWMEQYQEFTQKEAEFRDRKRDARSIVGDALTDAVEGATNNAGVTIDITDRAADDTAYVLRARLDRAAIVAAAAEALPEGFVVDRTNEDGTLTVAWDERDDVPDGTHYSAILKAIVAENVVTDEDGLVVSVPTRQAVLDRATDLGLSDEAARERLVHLADLEVIDLEDGKVYPDTNFGRF